MNGELGAVAQTVARALERMGNELRVREQTLERTRAWLKDAPREEQQSATVELLALAAKIHRLSPRGSAVEQLVELAADVVEARAGQPLGRL
jgi:hypothetical protein